MFVNIGVKWEVVDLPVALVDDGFVAYRAGLNSGLFDFFLVSSDVFEKLRVDEVKMGVKFGLETFLGSFVMVSIVDFVNKVSLRFWSCSAGCLWHDNRLV